MILEEAALRRGKLPVNHIIHGDALSSLKKLPSESVDCIITSPPYWGLRDYGVEGQIGLESSLDEYLNRLLEIMKELKRVLKKTGVIFWNHGDCYGGSGMGTWKNPPEIIKSKEVYHMPYSSNPRRRSNIKPKCMALQNYRFILRCVDELGLILRNIIIWYKPNHMPSSVKDRFTNAYEPIFMLTKNKHYWFDLDAVRVPHKEIRPPKIRKDKGKIIEVKEAGDRRNVLPYARTGIEYQNPLGKNPGDLWTISTQPFPEAHFATFPEKLVEPMIKAGCPQEICKRCGKPRERITKIKYNGKIISEKNKARDKRGTGVSPKTTLGTIPEYYVVGWKDCGCKEYYCCSCKKFIKLKHPGWEAGVVLDLFLGSGTTALVALKLGRRFVGIEINREYCEMALRRIKPLIAQSRLIE